jgi:hypothetical protein
MTDLTDPHSLSHQFVVFLTMSFSVVCHNLPEVGLRKFTRLALFRKRHIIFRSADPCIGWVPSFICRCILTASSLLSVSLIPEVSGEVRSCSAVEVRIKIPS